MHWFLDPVTNHYADFNGRATRKQFWFFMGLYLVSYIAVSVVAELIGFRALGFLYTLALLTPSVAIAARRLHDQGRSGWWQLVSLIPLAGLPIFVILMVLPGTDGPNKYDTNAAPIPMADEAVNETTSPEATEQQPPADN